MTCFERFRNSVPGGAWRLLAILAVALLFTLSCAQLPPKFAVSNVEGRVRAAAVPFDQGFRMPELAKACEGHWYCDPALYGNAAWKEVVLTLECRCEKFGSRRYGQLVENAYLIDKATLAVRPGGEERREEKYRLPKGSGMLGALQHPVRDERGLVVRGTHIGAKGKYGQSPGLIQSDSGNGLATLSYNAFGRETYSLIPNPSHLIGYAHWGTFFISVFDVTTRGEVGSTAIRYRGLAPDAFEIDFYGEHFLFKFPYDDYHGIAISLPE